MVKGKTRLIIAVLSAVILLSAAALFFIFATAPKPVKTACGTVVYDQYADLTFFTVYVSGDLEGTPEGLYNVPSDAFEELPEIKNGDTVEIQYLEVVGDISKIIPSDPSYFNGISEVNITGRADTEEYEAGIKVYNAYAENYNEYLDLNEARENGYFDTEGIVVDTAPLTVYLSELYPKGGIYPAFHLPLMYDTVETAKKARIGDRLKITSMGTQNREPRYLHNVTDMEILGKAEREEYDDIFEMYKDYLAREEYAREHKIFFDGRDRQVRHEGIVVRIWEDKPVIMYETSMGTEPEGVDFCSANYLTYKKPEIGDKVIFYSNSFVTAIGYTQGEPRSIGAVIHEITGRARGKELWDALWANEEYVNRKLPDYVVQK